MRDRRPGLLLLVSLLLAACQASPAVSGPAGTSPPTATVAPSVARTVLPAPSPTPIDYDRLLYGDSYAPTAGRPGGKVIVAEWQAATQLDPWYSNAFPDFEVLAATMRTLLRVTADGHYEPDLSAAPITYADSVRRDDSGDGFTVHVALKPGLTWSDGVPMTLNDLRYTWQWVNDPAQVGITPSGFEMIDRIDVASDGLVADVHFKQTYAGWLGAVGSNHILPEHYMKTIPIKDAAAKSYPVSATLGSAPTIGPFRYVTATSDTIELTRDEHWAGPAEACPGRACLDAVTFKYFPDNKEGEIAAFKNGEVDVALGLVQADYDAIKDIDPAVGRAVLEPGWLYEHLDMNEAGLGQGKGHPALQDLTVRRAIAQAIDKKSLWTTVFPGTPYPDDDPCTNATPTNYWRLPDATCPPFDVAAANAALDAAGYARGADGIRTDPKSKTPLVFENCTLTTGFRQLAAEFLAASLKEIGIQLDLEYVDGTGVLFAGWSDVKADTDCNLAHGTYDLAEFAYVLSFDLYGDYYYSYHSEQIPTEANKGNGYNTLRFKSPEMDEAIDVLEQAVAPGQQVDATYTIQRVYVDQVPEIVLYYRNEARGIGAKLQNFRKNPSTASDIWNVEDWWLVP
ncbi:MAG TPA: ABC transporter substrate-binding protein [Patescibacteria group bacterium]|nr:ABC transporter substrate-binding protein [Patescibacteria group bacterium]